MAGSIRIVVDDKEVLNRHYVSREYREQIINEATGNYETFEIFIIPDEQQETGQDAPVNRRGVGDIARGVHRVAVYKRA